jgi:hypothetical protein
MRMNPSNSTTCPVARSSTCPSFDATSTVVRSSRAAAIWLAMVRFQIRS